MITREDVSRLVLTGLRAIIAETYEQDQLEVPILDESTCLIGRRAVLDSLGLVNLIVDIEQKLCDEYAITITIADERAMSQEKSPFRTVQSLSDYIFLLIDEHRQHATA